MNKTIDVPNLKMDTQQLSVAAQIKIPEKINQKRIMQFKTAVIKDLYGSFLKRILRISQPYPKKNKERTNTYQKKHNRVRLTGSKKKC